MIEDRNAKYGPLKREKKTKTIAFRLTEDDADALMATAPEGETSIHKVARLAALEWIDENFRDSPSSG